MKATGIVRNIDKLGRIVIPKEIRKSLKIREDDSMEIFVSNEDLILRKYSPISSLLTDLNLLMKIVAGIINKKIIITDMSHIVAVSDINKEKYLNKNLSEEFINSINKRKKQFINEGDILLNYKNSFVIFPVIVNGDLFGSIVLETDNDTNDTENILIEIIHKFLQKRIED